MNAAREGTQRNGTHCGPRQIVARKEISNDATGAPHRRCAPFVRATHNMARIAGYCAGIGALEWAREGRLRVPGALRGALCALLATWCVLVKDDMAWVICAACCRGAHSRFEREASVGCRGLRCVWCVCGARASSRRRGLKRWGRVCGRHATLKYLSLRGCHCSLLM